MKNKLIALSLVSALALGVTNANAQTTTETKPAEFRANFKRVGLDISSTSVKNGTLYQNSPVSALSADDQTLISGVFDFALEYDANHYRWDNILFAKYTRKKTKAVNATTSEINESDDEIRLETDYSQKIWKLQEADVGPFANLGYQTEFTRNKGAEKTQILRGKTGVKLFNGKYIKNLYVAAVGEYDMTYNPYTEKLAMEVGGEFKYPIREGVDYQLSGYYRNYIHYSRYNGEDLKYDLNVDTRLNVKVVGRFSVSPFLSYRYAESRAAGKAGSNLMIGVSLAYDEIFKLN